MEVLRPSEIRFKQDSIKQEFQNGIGVNETALHLCAGEISASDFPTIRVAKKDNKYYSCDNRRLYVFRVAEYRGAVSYIRVRMARRHTFDEDLFTTKDDGRKVKVRSDRTLAHCKPHWLPKYTTRIPGFRELPARIQQENTLGRRTNNMSTHSSSPTNYWLERANVSRPSPQTSPKVGIMPVPLNCLLFVNVCRYICLLHFTYRRSDIPIKA